MTAIIKKRYEKNPLVQPHELIIKERVDMKTGEVHAVNAIYQRQVVDSERFAKIYLEGVARVFGLSKTAKHVFQIILVLCEKDSDRIYLSFTRASKLDERLQERTYHRGLLELLKAGFVAYSDLTNMFWINPHLFFNGDRVRFITEYVKRPTTELMQPPSGAVIAVL